MIDLDHIQSFVASRLAMHQAFAQAGLSVGSGILIEDGTYPKNAQLERMLNSVGIALVVWQVEALPSDAESPNGTTVFDIFLPVIVEENPRKNQTGVSAIKAVSEVLKAIVGQPKQSLHPGSRPFRTLDQPFQNLGMADGVQRYAVNLTMRHVITPQ